MNPFLETIKEKIDIVELIGEYVSLKPAGRNFKALCPFHKEKTPSFIVSPEKQIWHCFGACSEGGDIFKFLMKYENIEFYEAVKILAKKANIDLKTTARFENKEIETLYEINRLAKEFFKRKLWEDKNALDYLKKRGLKKEIIQEFELGFAPRGIDELLVYLLNYGFDISQIEKAGLIIKGEKKSYSDRFRERIIFPIFNHFSNPVGFVGRVIKDNDRRAKYLNSPETIIFNKSRILYGFSRTKEFIRKEKKAILVEGQMDLLMLYQDGVKNVVASSGTALTFHHLKALEKGAKELIFCLDQDEAGELAVEKGAELLKDFDFNLRILTIEGSKDPADFVLNNPGRFSSLVEKAKPLMEFYFDRYLNNLDNNPFELKEKVKIVLSKIKKLPSAIEKAFWIRKLSLKTKIREELLIEELERIKTFSVEKKVDREPNNNYPRINSRYELISLRLISLANLKKDFVDKLKNYFEFLPEKYLKLARHFLFKEKLDQELEKLADLVFLRCSLENEDLAEKEFSELLKQLEIEHLKEKQKFLAGVIKEAELSGDEEKLISVLKEFNQISEVISNYHKK